MRYGIPRNFRQFRTEETEVQKTYGHPIHGPCNGFFASVGGRIYACSVLANRVDRMLGFFSSVRIGTPHPLTRKCVCNMYPPFGWGWGGGVNTLR